MTPDRLIFLQAAWRHGDRSPLNTFKNDINQEDKWEQGWGQLTTRGMSQHVKLGRKLREKYVKDLQFISGTYKNHEIYVRSTDVNRTLTSAISNLIGFYGEGAREGVDYPNIPDWPMHFIPIAVHTVDTDNDHVGNPGAFCPRGDAIKKLVRKTPEYKQLMKEKEWLFHNLTIYCGEEINPTNFGMVATALYIEDIWSLTRNPWVTRELMNEINDVNWILKSWHNGERLKPYKGFDFSLELAKIRGGGIIWDMITNMRSKMDCLKQTRPNVSRKKEISPLCNWVNPLKYYVYSVHDTTLAALFATFGFNKTNYDIDGYPHYSACVTVELWQRVDGSNYIKVHYWIPGDEIKIVELTNHIVGCENGCSLEQFAARSLRYKAEPTPEIHCQNTELGEAGSSAMPILIISAFNLLGLAVSNFGFNYLLM
ncbi:histidine phosphatase superfamily (branch 2) domain-containing protein [Ditylenchus destructor]|uniref:acid phosphatase n=1 Tax=Ditylenchus destructor TaxID=166010 RepID=A0AAD4RBK4_9BILA|nr:histidine phosphatase superfamily (branch 2) domain-containing protein [Ditylenchus destructor]